MKTSVIISGLVLCFCVHSINAQELLKRRMINPTLVTLISDSSFRYSGALYQVKKSSILISNSTRLKDYSLENPNFSVSEIEITDIRYIKTLSRIKARNGMFIGAAFGFAIGGLMGIISNENSGSGSFISFPNWMAGLSGGIIIAPIGAFAGAIVGSFSVKISINGSMNTYSRNMYKLNKYAIKK